LEDEVQRLRDLLAEANQQISSMFAVNDIFSQL